MLFIGTSITIQAWLSLTFLEFRNLSPVLYEKLENQSLQPFGDRPRRLLVRHWFSSSEVLGLLCHVISVNMEHQMLPQLSLNRNL